MDTLKKIINFVKNIIRGKVYNNYSKKQTLIIKGNNAPVYILDNGIDKDEGAKNVNDDLLSEKSKKILCEAVQNNGFIYTDDNDKGKIFCGSLKIDLFNMNISEKTEWISAIEELENKGYIIGSKYNYGFYDDDSFENSFEVTKKGFDYFKI